MKRKKCIVLLPTAYNDGAQIDPRELVEILRQIEQTFDGYTIDGRCRGVYRMDDGTIARDTCIKVWVAVEPARVDDLRTFAAHTARRLNQESLYFEVTDADVEFVRPLPDEGAAP